MNDAVISIDRAPMAPPGGDPIVTRLIASELALQANAINLIAAVNYISPRVSMAMHPILESVHSEGYPGRRYHEGQAVADQIERLAIDRACELFGVEYANVQPYRGTMANLAAAAAVLQPGDVVLGLQTAAGGHYTTGSTLHLIGRMFRVVPYGVCANKSTLDYELIAAAARRERPRAIFCGDTSYPRLWDFAALRAIADEVGAVLVADISQSAGLIAGGAIPSPAAYADIMTAATYKTLRGPRAGLILARAHLGPAIDRAVSPICQGGTNVRILAGVAAALGEALTEPFRAYTRQVVENCRHLADELSLRGFDLMTDGTENHACLLDLRKLDVTGDVAARWLASAGILANGNQVANDAQSPRRPSGLRFGTCAVTTLGMGPAEITEIAELIELVLRGRGEPAVTDAVRERAGEIRRRFGTFEHPWYDADVEELV
ncbi:serine hydroxymethyltransferase [Luedemannella helvata]|uniref:Probable serine hydroxymethyltransferase n=1 Tax=Luedemannella helvata TaxID=349315 RepID=A0ABN2JUU8_9ACTN